VAKNTALRLAFLFVCLGLPAAAGCTNFASNRSNADGVTLFQRGQYQEALAQFQAATYADPGNADGYYNLGATYHRLGRLRTEKNDYLAQAEKNYRQCLDKNPNHRDCHRGLAVLLIEENRATEAFASIQTWAAQSPSLAEPRMELARLYEEFGNKEAAANSLAEAVRLNPDDPRQWAAMGKVREEMGDNNQALTDYQHSLGINPNQPDVTSRMASLQASLSHQPLALPPPPGTAPGATPVGAPSNTTLPILAGQPPPATR
jgi:tetratricopeptide (TPR) repeat protein